MQRSQYKKLALATGVIAGAVVCLMAAMVPVTQAASRGGAITDDSVCDVGDTEDRSMRIDTHTFVEKECKNGQVLLGRSVVPLGGNPSRIEHMAMSLCRVADIATQRSEGYAGGVIKMEYASVRCVISKHAEWRK
ncbi:MAG: hypothetical protein ACRCWJ_18655 [Casimicrobium sp.]